MKEVSSIKDIIDGRVNCVRQDTDIQPAEELLDMIVNNEKFSTIKNSSIIVSGSIKNIKNNKNYEVKVNKKEVSIDNQLNFKIDLQLLKGTNYIDIVLSENGIERIKKSIVVYCKIKSFSEKEVILWVEQFPNSHNLKTIEDIENMMLVAKDAGITSFGIDVKGPEGFVSYKKNDLSKSSHASEMKHPKKSGTSKEIDLLEEFVRTAHKLGMKVFASLNVFVEGSIVLGESDVLNKYPEWEEIVQRPEDKGALLPLSQSNFDSKLLSFVNPANDEVQELQLKRFEEVLKNYDIDGVNLDRCRYDNIYSDFSDVTKEKFQAYLSKKNKVLKNWPKDVYKIEVDGSMTKGSLYNDWWCFRSMIIKEFAEKVRELVNRYIELKGKKIMLSAYVGSWYEYLYQNGINWASPRFKYDSRLAFPDDSLYTEEYSKTGYIDNLDFIMIGAYYDTVEEVNKYITIGNIVTNGEIPIYTGIALTEIPKPEAQREIFQEALDNSDGLMIFDLCYTNWPIQKAAIKNNYYKDIYLDK